MTVDAGYQPFFEPSYPAGRPGPYQNFIYLRTLFVVPSIIRNPLEAFSRFQFETPVSRYKLFHMPFVLISDPKLIRQVFVDNADILKAEPLRQKILRPPLRDGMLTAEGHVWKRSRRAIAPVFAPRNVDGFANPMVEATKRFLDELKTDQDSVEIAPLMSRLAYLVLSETLFSGDIDEQGDQFLKDVAGFLKTLAAADPLDLLGAPDWLPRLTRLRGHGYTQRLRDSVRDAAKKRKRRMDSGEQVPNDFLTLLLSAQDSETPDASLSLDEVEDNLITFIAAGHETTARALAWTLYLLSQDTAARERVEREVDALDTDALAPQDWGKHLPWTTACFEEAMRLFPPAPVVLRQTKETIPHETGDIPAGSNVYVSQWVLHRHTLLWDRPNMFDPRRFMGDSRKTIDRFAYLPFGMGPRVCIGASFAMQEAQIALALMLKRFRFSYKGKKEPWPVMRITIQPDNEMPMGIEERSPSVPKQG